MTAAMDPIPAARITGLYRYPVKGLTPEPLRSAPLRVAQTLPADRRYALENGPTGFDPAAPIWKPKTAYLMLMRNERLAGFKTLFEDATNTLTIRKDGAIVAQGDLESTEGRADIENFFATEFADELRGPPKLLSGGGYSFTDLARKVVSIINLASLAEIEKLVGAAVHPLRFRANIYVAGWPAWHEASLMGETLRIGSARLKVVKTTTRCAAVNVDPDTAARDLDIPSAIVRDRGNNECGIYAEVIAAGDIAVGDELAVEQPSLL
ncbi:MOSC domain-containing protein [Bradyrhizobium ontarionense]|uniref:MOSC domain-containing protein n=1 Tax=Bradyrhizobium ontarionense TaxID=2898149 RepID=A0ABY3R7H4_9BRAD|nr:MOSC domain-containing protein [Bradyrhizobium sp. A19]UFZ03275.1 MOSC domain-containing protein [Bradyrhizobium sp. A19]